MQRLQLLIILSAFYVSLIAQTAVGVHNHTVTISPSYTVNNGTQILVSGYIENKGTTSISNNVHVNLGIDTSSTSTPKYYWRTTTTYSVTNLLVGNTFSFSVTDVADVANAYKGGGGTTVVIWAIVGSLTNTVTTADSAKTTIYLIGVPQGIDELTSFEESPVYFKNPSTGVIKLNYNESIFTKVELYDMSGKFISKGIDKTININDLPKGLYLLKFWNDKTKHNVIKKIIIE